MMHKIDKHVPTSEYDDINSLSQYKWYNDHNVIVK